MECNVQLEEALLATCKELQVKVSSDFTGIALQQSNSTDIKWPFVAGNCNEKYKFITVRYGKGIAGKVIATGSPMTIEHFPDNIIGKSIEYPIMLAENLISAYARPIMLNGRPKGAVLIGFRKKYTIQQNADEVIKTLIEKIEDLIKRIYNSN
ncbi:GAF domain-containing protein [Aquibacillus kalidii]|uniref:GAF domain-containing protein n=1 Tax=Aquibacillus kalidii TaxID=2762597 RepID=UPI00164622C3|nr:GAF domain-containing protein [Aquibacillus kalidii]